MFVWIDEIRAKAIDSVKAFKETDRWRKERNFKPEEIFFDPKHGTNGPTDTLDFDAAIDFVRAKSSKSVPILKHLGDLVTLLRFLKIHHSDLDIDKYDSVCILRGKEDILRLAKRKGHINHVYINLGDNKMNASVREYMKGLERNEKNLKAFKKGFLIGLTIGSVVGMLLLIKRRLLWT